MEDDLERILTFLDVVESGGFAKAAARRGVSHSTVSRHVQELEERLGVPLMTRTTRTKHLTSAGEIVVRGARDLRDRCAELAHELERTENIQGGTLRISALVHIGHALVMPAIEAFCAEHPDVEVDLRFHDGPLDFHEEGLDMALTVGPPTSSRLVVKKLCDNPVCIIASRELAAKRPAPEHPRDVLEWPAVAYRSGGLSVTEWPYEEDGALHALEIRPSIFVNDGVSLADAVRRGMGIGYVSRFSVIEELDAGALVDLLPEWHLPAYAPIYMVKADLSLVSARVEAMERHLRAVAEAKVPG